MKIVAQRSGLSPHVIRVWEKRYNAVEPSRTDTNRRLYSDADISRLSILRVLTEAGHSIGQIASLPTEQLEELARQTNEGESGLIRVLNSGETDVKDLEEESRLNSERFLRQALVACIEMDQERLEAVLDRAAVAFGYSGLVEHLAGPLIAEIGERWHRGRLSAAHEHAATATIRSYIENNVRGLPLTDNAPRIVVTTPAGQMHELGAVLVMAVARRIGWRVIYLGPSLPASEIVGAVIQSGAACLALSLAHPADDPGLPAELARLRKLLPDDVLVFAGGRAADSYAGALEAAGVEILPSLTDLRQRLEELRLTPM